jgi:SAM-dependent methyltransferase
MKLQTAQLLERVGLLRVAFRLLEQAKSFDLTTFSDNISTPDGLPLPPRKLRVLVAGNAYVASFIEGGQLARQSIQDVLSKNGIELEELGAILDFGCGCGRVIRHWQSLRNIKIYGSDYNPELLAWCRRHLAFAEFSKNELAPPLPFRADQFGLVYALSVFTHLPHDLQMAWMNELRRVIQPGGYLILTTHGASYLSMLTEKERTDFHAGRMVIRYETLAGTNMCSTFHPAAYVQDTLAKGFEVVDYIPEGAKGNPTQDLFLLRKPTG